MDYEDIANFTFEEYITPEQSAAEIANEVIFTIFCLVGVCADAVIIFTILRFERMRTIPQILIANWAIADLCSLIFTPSAYRLIYVVRHIPMSPEFLCGLDHFGVVFHITELLYIILLSVDWFIAAHFTNTSERLRGYHRYIIATIWILSLLTAGIITGMCMADNNSYFSHILLDLCLWTITIITVLLQVWRAVLKYYFKKPLEYPALTLILTTAFGGCWLLAFITMQIDGFFRQFTLLATVAYCLVFSSSLVNFTLLFCLNNDFQACLVQTFKRCGNGYKHENFDFENSVFKNTDVNGTSSAKLSFDRLDELLITDEN